MEKGQWICGDAIGTQLGKIKSFIDTGYIVINGYGKEQSWGDAVQLATAKQIKNHLINVAFDSINFANRTFNLWEYDIEKDELKDDNSKIVYSDGKWDCAQSLPKEIKSSQKYTFEITHYKDGSSIMNRTNTGFSVLEILGITALVQNDMMKLLSQSIKPIEVNRTSTDSPLIRKPEDNKPEGE